MEEEKKREHEKHLAELDHDEKLKQLDLERVKEQRASEFTKTAELADTKLKQEKVEHKHKIE